MCSGQLCCVNWKLHCSVVLCLLPRSLFEKDKLLFGFGLAIKLKLDAGLISQQELRFLMTGVHLQGSCLYQPGDVCVLCWQPVGWLQAMQDKVDCHIGC